MPNQSRRRHAAGASRRSKNKEMFKKEKKTTDVQDEEEDRSGKSQWPAPHRGGPRLQADLGLAARLPVVQHRGPALGMQRLHGAHSRVRALRACGREGSRRGRSGSAAGASACDKACTHSLRKRGLTEPLLALQGGAQREVLHALQVLQGRQPTRVVGPPLPVQAASGPPCQACLSCPCPSSAPS